MKMDRIINLDIPHIGEQIFENINTKELITCLSVSKSWKVLAENVILKRYKGQIFKACGIEDAEVVKILLDRSEEDVSQLNVPKTHNYTPLMIACRCGNKNVVELLLAYSESKGIEVNAGGGENETTAFMIACLFGFEKIVKVFLTYQGNTHIDLNLKNNQGKTAFMLAKMNAKLK